MPCWGSNHISHEQGTCSNYYNLSRALQAIFFFKVFVTVLLCSELVPGSALSDHYKA